MAKKKAARKIQSRPIRAWGGFAEDGELGWLRVGLNARRVRAVYHSRAEAREAWGTVRRVEVREVAR